MARPRKTPPSPFPSLWTDTTLGSAPALGDDAATTDDPLAAWRTFWRAAGVNVPTHINRARRLRGAIRRLGLE